MRKVKLIINKETDMLKNQDVSVIETEIVWVFFFSKGISLLSLFRKYRQTAVCRRH